MSKWTVAESTRSILTKLPFVSTSATDGAGPEDEFKLSIQEAILSEAPIVLRMFYEDQLKSYLHSPFKIC